MVRSGVTACAARSCHTRSLRFADEALSRMRPDQAARVLQPKPSPRRWNAVVLRGVSERLRETTLCAERGTVSISCPVPKSAVSRDGPAIPRGREGSSVRGLRTTLPRLRHGLRSCEPGDKKIQHQQSSGEPAITGDQGRSRTMRRRVRELSPHQDLGEEMAGTSGLEPELTEPESVGLPITPRPKEPLQNSSGILGPGSSRFESWRPSQTLTRRARPVRRAPRTRAGPPACRRSPRWRRPSGPSASR